MDNFEAACDLEVTRKEKNGWSTKFHYKVRPGAREFIEEISSLFEVGFYSNLPAQISNSIVRHLDPDQKHISFSIDSRHCLTFKNDKSESYLRKDLTILSDRSIADMFYVASCFDIPLGQLSKFIPLVPFNLNSNKEEGTPSLSELKDYLTYLNSCRQLPSQQDLSLSEDADPFSLQLVVDNLALQSSEIYDIYLSSVKNLLS